MVAFSESLFYEVEDRGRTRHGGEPGLRRDREFPLAEVMDARVILDVERVAEAVVKVVRDDIAPELLRPSMHQPAPGVPRAHTPPVPLGRAIGPRVGARDARAAMSDGIPNP